MSDRLIGGKNDNRAKKHSQNPKRLSCRRLGGAKHWRFGSRKHRKFLAEFSENWNMQNERPVLFVRLPIR